MNMVLIIFSVTGQNFALCRREHQCCFTFCHKFVHRTCFIRMEYVELDAKREKHIVETKLQEKDVKGAIIFARRVHGLFPELKRLFQFLGNLVVHVSSEGEELDWYTVLGVNPSADSKTLRRCYVKLAKNGLDSLKHIKFWIKHGVSCLINLQEKHMI